MTCRRAMSIDAVTRRRVVLLTRSRRLFSPQ
jgi:hypothetical protein